MVRAGATHIAVATDHVIESFRNNLYPGYKTGEGVYPALLAQFPFSKNLSPRQASWSGLWSNSKRTTPSPPVPPSPLSIPASNASSSARPTKISPNASAAPASSNSIAAPKNSRRSRRHPEVRRPPASIPDYLALVGDTADGYPGLPGWGAKSTAPFSRSSATSKTSPPIFANGASTPPAPVPSPARSPITTPKRCCYRTLATLRTDIPLFKNVDEIRCSVPLSN